MHNQVAVRGWCKHMSHDISGGTDDPLGKLLTSQPSTPKLMRRNNSFVLHSTQLNY